MNEAWRDLDGRWGKDYTGKLRPAVIVQEDSFDATDSITICAFTTDETDAPLLRLVVRPSGRNGLHSGCRLMIDKVTTVPKSKVGVRIGSRPVMVQGTITWFALQARRARATPSPKVPTIRG